MHTKKGKKGFQKIPLRDRFFKKVRKTPGCWEWTATKTCHGYGMIYDGISTIKVASRISWELHVGTIPENRYVLHRCDNPGCVNPAHLFLGTLKDNSRDMVEKGRGYIPHVIGESHGMCKLKESQVREIRRRYAAGETQLKLANEFGVKFGTISKIHLRQTWSHID